MGCAKQAACAGPHLRPAYHVTDKVPTPPSWNLCRPTRRTAMKQLSRDISRL